MYKTIRAHLKSAVSIFRTFKKKLFISWHCPLNQCSLQEKDEEEEDEEDEEEEEDAVEAVTEALNDQLMRQKKERGQEERTASMAASSPAPKSILKHSDSSFGLHSPDSLNDDVQVSKVKK